jgi:hypothetical protein
VNAVIRGIAACCLNVYDLLSRIVEPKSNAYSLAVRPPTDIWQVKGRYVTRNFSVIPN